MPDPLTTEEEDLLLLLDEADPITIDPIEIEGRTPYSTSPGGKEPLPIGTTVPENEDLLDRIGFHMGLRGSDTARENARADFGRQMDESRSPSASAVRGTADAFTFGHADELRGLVDPRDEGYEGARDAERQRQDELAEANPGAWAGGQLFGVAAQLPLLAAAPAAEGGLLARGATYAAEGGAFGALGASGASDDDILTDEWADDVYEGALGGAAFGGATGLGGEALGAAVPAVRRWAARQRTSQVTGGSNLVDDLARMGSSPEEAAAQLDDMGVFRGMIPRRRATLANRTAEAGEQASRALDDISSQLDETPADLAGALRRARRAIERGDQGAASLDAWIPRLMDAADQRRASLGGELAQMAGSGSEGLAARQALRAARSGEPIAFGTLETWRREIADELLRNPNAALQSLHDDIAGAMSKVADGAGVGDRFREAVQQAELAGLVGARQAANSGVMNTVRNAVTAGAAGGIAGAARAAGDVAGAVGSALDPISGGVGAALAAGASTPGVRYQAGRALGNAAEVVAPVLRDARRVAGPVGELVSDDPADAAPLSEDELDALLAPTEPEPDEPLSDEELDALGL